MAIRGEEEGNEKKLVCNCRFVFDECVFERRHVRPRLLVLRQELLVQSRLLSLPRRLQRPVLRDLRSVSSCLLPHSIAMRPSTRAAALVSEMTSINTA